MLQKKIRTGLWSAKAKQGSKKNKRYVFTKYCLKFIRNVTLQRCVDRVSVYLVQTIMNE